MALQRSAGTLVTLGWLAVVWTALWGDLSWGNLVGGLLAGALVLLLYRLPVGPSGHRLSWPAAALYLVGFLRDLVVATAEVAAQVFWPVDRLRPAVVEVPLRSTDRVLLALVADTITLTPGTLTLETDRERARLWVHVLHLREGGAPAVVAQAQALERLGARALGIDLPAEVPR